MPQPFRLYFFFQPTCGACHMAEPHFDRFAAKNPAGIYPKINVAMHRQKVAGFRAKATPTYLLIPFGQTEGEIYEGALTEPQLADFVRRATGGEPEHDDEEDVERGLVRPSDSHDDERRARKIAGYDEEE